MSKFTKGPWYINKVSDDVYIDTQTGWTIAKVFDANGLVENASLIAAAPDIHEALEGMIDMYTALINSGDCGNWDPEEDKEVIAARKSITKARGD